MIVLDASAAAELLLDTAAGARVHRRLHGEAIHAPVHFDVEVVGVIRRAILRDLLTDRDGQIAFADFQALAVRRWPLQPLIGRAFELRGTTTVADGAYLALAEGLDAPLVTCDSRLARSHGHDAHVEAL